MLPSPSPACLALLRHFEGLRLFAYPDPASDLARATPQMAHRWGFEPAAGILAELAADVAALPGSPWTCGYGHTRGVTSGSQCTEEGAEAWLADDAQIACTEVDRMLLVSVTQCERDALTSFDFAFGSERLFNSTLLRKLNKGDRTGAADQFLRWKLAGGRVEPGLVARREAERRMFLGLDWRGENEPT